MPYSLPRRGIPVANVAQIPPAVDNAACPATGE
jgi:hypothetical protein